MTQDRQDREFTSIVVSGGIFKVISVIGVIKYLEENVLINNLKNYVGTSAGSIICFMLALGLNSDELKKMIIDLSKDDEILQFDIDMDSICNMIDTYGIDSGNRIEIPCRKILLKKLYRKDITFLEFTKITGKNLVICVSNLTKEKTEYWSVDTQPNMSVIKAIRISCSVPIFFPPVKIDDMLYLDGGVYNNFPLGYFKENYLKNIIGINIVSSNYQNTDNFIQYMRFLIFSVIETSQTKLINDFKNNVITLEFNEKEKTTTFKDFKCIISDEIIDKYILNGYETTKKHFSTFNE
jgi:predicted acylesterase/phospholipase RssA